MRFASQGKQKRGKKEDLGDGRIERFGREKRKKKRSSCAEEHNVELKEREKEVRRIFADREYVKGQMNKNVGG